MKTGQALRLFDEAAHQPARRDDAIGDLFAGLAAMAAQAAAEKRARKEAAREARRNDPVARARRSARSRKGWETRYRRQAAAEALEAAAERIEAERFERESRLPAVTCPQFDFVRDAVETTCVGEPGHRGDHEDIDGHTWPNDCDGTCGVVCDC